MTATAPFLTVCLTTPPSGAAEVLEVFGRLTGTPAPDGLSAQGLDGAFAPAEARAGEAAVKLLPAGKGLAQSAAPLLILELGAADASAPLRAEVLCNAQWDSPMCGLSLEDAVLLEGLDAVLKDDAPARKKNPWGDDVAPTPPGAAAWLRLTGGATGTRAETATRILRRAASIMLRRIDAARARLAEGPALRGKLGLPATDA